MPHALLESLTPRVDRGDFARVRELVSQSAAKVVVLDDDPTGTQTVHGIEVLSEWSVPALADALRAPEPCFYILTNSRSLPEGEAADRTLEVARNLAAAGAETGIPFTVISRSDSTLRGHFAAELAALEAGIGAPVDATLVIPAFFEGGRHTIGDIHYVSEGGHLVPAAATEFARDATFGYRKSNLREWVEEKTKGRFPAAGVASLSIESLRSADGAGRARDWLLGLPRGTVGIVNAAEYGDLESFTHGLLQAEARGRRFLLRTAASFVRVRAGTVPRPLLSPGEIFAPGPGGGLVVVGSYVGRSTAQLEALLGLPGVRPVELFVDRLADPVTRAAESERAAGEASAVIRTGLHAVLFSSRGRASAIGVAGDLTAGRIVSEALVAAVRGIPDRPRFLIAKGGITASDLAIDGLGMKRARVLGQAAPGVPVWRLGPETRHPGLAYIVWPGNVGTPDSLKDLVARA